MTPQRWTRIKEVFGTALETPEPERPAFLDSACGRDAELRADVERLLAESDAASLHSPASGFLNAAAELAPGDTVAHYRIEARLGEGGMGVVYKAWDERLQRAVAIKTIRGVREGEEARKGLWREARSLARVSHPNVCQVFDADQDGETLFLVLELLEGQSLAGRLATGPLATAETMQIARQVLAALGALHRLGIVHRDLKPSNVFLTPHGVKLLDFGLARSTATSLPAGGEWAPTVTNLTAPGMILGTPHYMSPEQASGMVAGPGADIFATGCMLYEMLAGKRAFDGDSFVDVLYQVMHHEPPALGGSQEIEALNGVIRRALAKRPQDRYASAIEMVQALNAATMSAGTGAASPTRTATRLIVLPFRILRKDEETEFLAYSLPDAISSSLSGLDSLTVRSTLAALRFEGQAADPKKIAVEADVDAILTGSLMRVGAQLRLSCQLLAAPSGTLIWSDALDVSMNDLFQVQDGLANQIVQSLMLPLTEREHRILRHDVPRSAKAYEYYLRANQLSVHRSIDNMRLARELYAQCLEEDPDFAPAWARLGRVHRFIEKFGEATEENLNLADEEFRRAFSLNPDLALAHNLYTSIECDQGRAQQAMVRLLERARFRRHDPDLFAGLVQACRYCDELQASVAAHHYARRLDPHVVTSAEHTYFLLGEYQKTLAFYDTKAGYYLDAAALAALDRNQEALERLRQRGGTGGGASTVGAAMRSLRAYLEGNFAECLRAIPELEALTRMDPEALFYVARHLARINERERAIATLGKVIDCGFLCASSLARDPWLASLREAPGFGELAQKAERRRIEIHAAFLDAGGEQLLSGA
ncbi:MAG: protein kinase [Bryobacteraceae bacterium]|jgi:non-specific serine/threonine protein kinase